MHCAMLNISVACPPGTYSINDTCALCEAGFYNDGFYATSCKSCPAETNSKKVGAMQRKDCYGMDK